MNRGTTDRHAILVVGGTGKTGRRVGNDWRRAAAGACRLAIRGATVRLGRPRDLGAGTRGRRSVYVAYYPDIAFPGRRRCARLRGAGGSERQPAGWRCCPAAASQKPNAPSRLCAIPAPTWTILRSTWFMQNFSEDYMRVGATLVRGTLAGVQGVRRYLARNSPSAAKT